MDLLLFNGRIEVVSIWNIMTVTGFIFGVNLIQYSHLLYFVKKKNSNNASNHCQQIVAPFT